MSVAASPPADAVAAPRPAPRHRGRWQTAIWAVVLAAAGVAWWRDPHLHEKVLAVLEPPAPQAKPQAPRVVPVSATEARRTDLAIHLDSLGSVVAANTVTVRSRVDGELVSVAFSEGQSVNAGDLLAEIDPRPFAVRLRQAEGQLARDEAALQAARLDLERYESLTALKQVTDQQLDAQRALVRQSEAAVEIDRGTIDDVRLQLDYCRITAPIAGRIGLRLVDQGNIVRANDPTGIAVIAQLHPITIVFTVPQDEIIRVQRALAAEGSLPVEAYNRDFRTRLAAGRLIAIDNQVDVATGTVRLKAEFPNEDDTLFPNQFVNARLLVETIRDAVVVPRAAVQTGPQSTFVYVVQPDSTVSLRPVKTAATQDELVALAEGVAPGDLVVTDGIDKIVDRAKVAVRGGAAPGQPAVAARP